jgi:hypothetical protein
MGTWSLDVSKSTFATILTPGVPAGSAIVSQKLTLAGTAQAIRLSGDTVMSGSTGSHSSHDGNSLALDGKETVIGPVTLSFRPIDGSAFEILTRLNLGNRSFVEVSHFSFSSDGKTLTETKTQTETESGRQSSDETKGAARKSSTSILVFHKVSEK